MTRSRQLRRPSSWWDRGSVLLRRLRQEPGTLNVHRHAPLVDKIVRKHTSLRELSEDELAARVGSVRADVLNDDRALVEFLALAGETARRRLDLEPFEVQLLATVTMLRGGVVDMATGEGKTLVGFLVAAGYAVSGRQVHVLSANDYLARRDAAAGEPFFSAFGLDVAAVVDGMEHGDRRNAYRATVTYSTVHQVGFDLLRDRQRTNVEDVVLPDLDTAVLDEIDAVLIDDAMVPLVIAGDAEPETADTAPVDAIGRMIEDVHYEVDGERRNVSFTDAGIDILEAELGIDDLYAEQHAGALTSAHVALHAHALVRRDVHYVVNAGQVRLINDVRGRVADRQRWPDGLHAAIERKEGLEVTAQAEILDQVLVETVARGYRTLTGMSGTALEAAERLAEDFKLPTGVIPTNRPCIRVDEPDRLFLTTRQRDAAAAERVREAHAADRPVLIGTASITESEGFAALLDEHGVESVVLNAKNDAAEAAIVGRAGYACAVTVSTQMAGRGVDISLGPDVAESGGLFVLGLGRYDSARLDQQIRGRSGRQGDPGRSVFYTSLDDDVVTENLILNERPRSPGPDGTIPDRAFRRHYEHAQRVAEGKLLQLHRTSRSYNKTTDAHRELLLETRRRLIAEPSALDDYLIRLWPDEPAKARQWMQPDKRRLAREVVLYQLDRAWTEQLNFLAEIREGIHLRVLGRQNPLEEFNLLAVKAFRTLAPRTADAVRDTLDRADESTTSLADLGFRRPSSTWTYMVHDNPFGSEADRVVASIGKFLRRGEPPAISYT